ncbi:hypothetical protein FDUTEX481_04515 [Tolypothrix sp. PCC 7601]|nr:hypothetical protein FDUTEX481_04515 [Tolypothrix sp. PCC 7601]
MAYCLFSNFLTVCVGVARQRHRLAMRLQEQTQQLEQLQALRYS